MTYLITFLEGLITFVSPCLLPMLPIYISYFAGGKKVCSAEKRFGLCVGLHLGLFGSRCVRGLGRPAFAAIPACGEYCQRADCHLLWLTFSWGVPARLVQGRHALEPRESNGVLVRGSLRHGLLCRLDPMRGPP